MSRLPYKLTSEELLELLETASEDTLEVPSFDNDIPVFLSKHKLESGENFIRPSLLYRLYCVFSESPVNQLTFSINTALFIQRSGSYFKMNITPQYILKILNPQVNKNHINSHIVKKHYELFLEKSNIESGTVWVKGMYLHEIYRFYCIDNKVKNRISHDSFIAISRLHFENKRIGTNRAFWFKLNINVASILTPEHMERVQNASLKDEKWSNDRKPKRKKNDP
jgi:hypothetical protein